MPHDPAPGRGREPHRITLRGPWEYEWLSPGEHVAGKLRMPADWQSQFGGQRGRVRFYRRFNRPTNLGESRVLIVLSGVGGTGEAFLNSQSLGGVAAGQANASFDVTDRLAATNELLVELEFHPGESSSPGGLYGPVVLEIHEP